MQEEDQLWKGNLIDGNGYRGTVLVTFSLKKDVVSIMMNVFGRPTTSTTIVWEASLDGQNPMAGVRLVKSEDLPSDCSLHWEIDLSPANPEAFALAALIGTYIVQTKGTECNIPLAKGVMVIWLFKE